MRAITPILATAIMYSAAVAGAQSPKVAATPSGNVFRTYHLIWTVTEMDGPKRLSTQKFSMTLVNGTETVVKLGSKVPLVTGSYNDSNSHTQTQFTYVDVGLNLKASLNEVAGQMHLSSKVEQSSVAEDKSTVDVREPIIRQAVLEGTSIPALHKPLTLGSLDIPGSTRHLDIEVVMELAAQAAQ